ncbi:hypothetical protein EDB89DRAFT_438537 [Lactarius sanguifluus]|nr:hypothetical protein EDB89DRAFT_438537 [Lactarius sanguifluus]
MGLLLRPLSTASLLLKRAPGSGDRTMVSTAGDPRSLVISELTGLISGPSRSAGRMTTTTATTPSTECSTCSWVSDTRSSKSSRSTSTVENSTHSRRSSAHAPHEGNACPIGQLQLEIHGREGRENFEYFARVLRAGGRRASGRSGRSRTWCTSESTLCLVRGQSCQSTRLLTFVATTR